MGVEPILRARALAPADAEANMHKHDIGTLKRRAEQARELARSAADPEAINRLLGAATGYELEAERLEARRRIEGEIRS
jgi:hypothetical protein